MACFSSSFCCFKLCACMSSWPCYTKSFHEIIKINTSIIKPVMNWWLHCHFKSMAIELSPFKLYRTKSSTAISRVFFWKNDTLLCSYYDGISQYTWKPLHTIYIAHIAILFKSPAIIIIVIKVLSHHPWFTDSTY